MRDGPVQDVPLGIQIFNRTVIAVTIGPDKVQSHFGSAPVYGVVSNASKANPTKSSGQAEGMGLHPLNSTAANLGGLVRKDVSYYGNSTGYLVYPENANKTLLGIVMIHEWGLEPEHQEHDRAACKQRVRRPCGGPARRPRCHRIKHGAAAVRHCEKQSFWAIENMNAAVDYLAS